MAIIMMMMFAVCHKKCIVTMPVRTQTIIGPVDLTCKYASDGCCVRIVRIIIYLIMLLNQCLPCLCECVPYRIFKSFLSVQYVMNYFSFPGFATEHKCISADVIRKAVRATEEGFLSLVGKEWPVKPQIAAVGSCCLVGVICAGTLYVANLGDSRAVLGRLVKATGEVLSMQLSSEHNASHEEVRQELKSSHPHDPHIVVLKHNVWRVKGIIQVDKDLYYDIRFLVCDFMV
jgi:hypothetical protein